MGYDKDFAKKVLKEYGLLIQRTGLSYMGALCDREGFVREASKAGLSRSRALVTLYQARNVIKDINTVYALTEGSAHLSEGYPKENVFLTDKVHNKRCSLGKPPRDGVFYCLQGVSDYQGKGKKIGEKNYYNENIMLEVFNHDDLDGEYFVAVGENQGKMLLRKRAFDQLEEVICEQKKKFEADIAIVRIESENIRHEGDSDTVFLRGNFRIKAEYYKDNPVFKDPLYRLLREQGVDEDTALETMDVFKALDVIDAKVNKVRSYNTTLKLRTGDGKKYFAKLLEDGNLEQTACYLLSLDEELGKHFAGSPFDKPIRCGDMDLVLQHDKSDEIVNRKVSSFEVMDAYAKLYVHGMKYAKKLGLREVQNKEEHIRGNGHFSKRDLGDISGFSDAVKGEGVVLKDTKWDNRDATEEGLLFHDLERLRLGNPAVPLSMYFAQEGFDNKEILENVNVFCDQVEMYSKGEISFDRQNRKDIVDRTYEIMPAFIMVELSFGCGTRSDPGSKIETAQLVKYLRKIRKKN